MRFSVLTSTLALAAPASAFAPVQTALRVTPLHSPLRSENDDSLNAHRARPVALTAAGAPVIDALVSLDTFAPQFLWVLMVAAPRTSLTARVMGPIAPVIALSLAHLAIVLLAASAPGGTEPVKIFADVFDPAQNQLDGMVRLFEVRDFVAEEWPHVLIWDLFVGRAIWLDSLERDVGFTWAALLLTNGIGPPGLLLYVTICLLSGRGVPSMGYRPQDRAEY